MISPAHRRGGSRRNLQSIIAFSLSWMIHLLAGLLLALVVLNAPGNGLQHPHFTLGSESNSPDELAQFSISSSSSMADSPNPIPVPATPEMLSPFQESINPELIIGPNDTPVATSIDMALIASISGGGSLSDTELDQTSPSGSEKSGASFFGAQAHGDRFVFVIDSSGSMRGSRWYALCKELLRAIRSLSPEQEFFVISFDSSPHPMFGKLPRNNDFLKPNETNVKKLSRWINSILHGSNTFPASAVGMAIELKPDAIFLLSDGEIKDSTLFDLRTWNRKRGSDGEEEVLIPIHTVLLHSEVGYATLQAIATENDGSFTPVPAFGALQ